jgi:hypothetical protein
LRWRCWRDPCSSEKRLPQKIPLINPLTIIFAITLAINVGSTSPQLSPTASPLRSVPGHPKAPSTAVQPVCFLGKHTETHASVDHRIYKPQLVKDLKDPSPAANLGTFNRSNQWIPQITRMNIPGKIVFHLGVAQGMVLQKISRQETPNIVGGVRG